MRPWVTLVALCTLLGACSDPGQEDLRHWMAENSQNLRGNIPRLPEVKAYEPVAYQAEAVLDPFQPGKIEPDSKTKQAGGKGGAFQPDFEAREIRNSVLEKYPLESLRMIGYLNINTQPMVVIQVDNKIKQAKVGDYLGQDFGLVIKVSETEVQVRELIQDSAGDWGERKISLLL